MPQFALAPIARLDFPIMDIHSWPDLSRPLMPPDLAAKLGQVADRLNVAIDDLIRAAWLDGLRTGIIGTAVVMLLLWVVVETVRRK